MNLRPFMILTLVTSMYVLAGVPAKAAAMDNGVVQVSFNSVSITQSYPQAYSFGVTAAASPGSSIMNLTYQFGDGSSKESVYCCQPQVSEIQYHIYSQPGTYNVSVTAYDNVGNFASAEEQVNWPTGLNGQQPGNPSIALQAQATPYASWKFTPISPESLSRVALLLTIAFTWSHNVPFKVNRSDQRLESLTLFRISHLK